MSFLNRSRSQFVKWASGLFEEALLLNNANIVTIAKSFVTAHEVHNLLDVGCGDGVFTRALATAARIDEVHGIDTMPGRLDSAAAHDIRLQQGDLNERFDYADETFDIVVSNQVIEHLYDTDSFLSESWRVLKPGGLLIVSTENAASWHNVFALVLGWQPFSLTNVSRLRGGIGNPIALNAMNDGFEFPLQHHRIFSLRGLTELLAVHSFSKIGSAGSGYHPLPPQIGRIDASHAHFICAYGTKPVPTEARHRT